MEASIQLTTTNLPSIERIKTALQKAETLQEVRQIKTVAEMAAQFYRAQSKTEEAQNACAAALWAQRRAGEMLKAMPKNTGVRMNGKDSFGGNIVLPPNDAPTLQELDISKAEASRWQMLAEVPLEMFQNYIDEKIASGYEVTASGLLKIAKQERFKAELRRQQEEIERGAVKLPEGVFEVIVIDPPWQYGTQYDPNGRRAANPYPEMSLEQIKALEIPAAEDCVLFLWTTHKFMRHAFEVLDAWGFRDVAIITWVKDRIGLGTWLRSQTEFCIMAVKGSPKVSLTNQSTVLFAPMREHSRKPDEFYRMVESLCVGRRLDYFSREKRAGWQQYGNEPDKFAGKEVYASTTKSTN